MANNKNNIYGIYGLSYDSRKLMSNLTKDAIEARKLGLSYGQYIAYRDTGYLEHFKRMQFREKSERRADGRKVHFDSTKMEDNF